jgi:hypothetical protein
MPNYGQSTPRVGKMEAWQGRQANLEVGVKYSVPATEGRLTCEL